ncbi:MAG TPA: UDP-N-acetylmuramoyl-tripeptide--D-alanyl-D-alanine ligase [Caulobacteraceae bacterium]|nr:UDP-N-acetylmuramoyl-tripeptide--D-alanyl-D-alanine ligase [Caulobacteraceae bacterium]
MAEPLWTSEEIAQATDGLRGGASFEATGVSIDTRTLEAGDLFVALAGERDGHEFVSQAQAKGAAGVLVSRPMAGAAIVVDDTLAALEQLGMAARERAPQARRGAVTGSVGKTSLTQAIAGGLALAGPSHTSVKSYNNHIGVPLTLARMPRRTERAIFEVGMNHPGEITPLTRMIAPHAVAVTNVGIAHIENFADGERGIARAKAEIFAGLAPSGIAVLNADDRWFETLKADAERAGARIRTFGIAESADARLLGFEIGEGASVRAMLDGRELDFPLRQTGAHWGVMSLAALLMLQALDVGLDHALAALAAFEPLEGRGATRTLRLDGGEFTLVDESYNANPVSVSSALKTLGARPAKGRRIVALTDMLELGADSRNLHAGLAEPIAAAGVDLVFAAGPLMKSLFDALPPTRRGGYADDAAGLAPRLARAIEPGDVVMVKGSRDSHAKALVEALAALEPLAGEAR